MSDNGDKWWNAVKSTVTPLSSIGRRKRAPKPVVEVVPRTLDLHGMTVQQAYEATMEFVNQSDGKINIITGKSGQINREFPRWLESNGRINSMNDAGGSFGIVLGNRKKVRSK